MVETAEQHRHYAAAENWYYLRPGVLLEAIDCCDSSTRRGPAARRRDSGAGSMSALPSAVSVHP
jgi:hypothetical protein